MLSLDMYNIFKSNIWGTYIYIHIHLNIFGVFVYNFFLTSVYLMLRFYIKYSNSLCHTELKDRLILVVCNSSSLSDNPIYGNDCKCMIVNAHAKNMVKSR